MDYRLHRRPDGTVNAVEGDAVEFLYGNEWRPALYRGLLPQNTNTIDIAILRLPGEANDFPTTLEHVRFPIGSAGYYRLQVEQLRDVIELVNDRQTYHFSLVDVLADIDQYEFGQPNN